MFSSPRIAITGGTGFVGRHLANRYPTERVVLASRRNGGDVADVDSLTRVFEGCDVVAHFAGINREIGAQTFRRVHVEGTAAVIEAAQRAGVRKVILLSFLRARPGTRSGYHQSKWEAEELIRASGLDYTILKAGMIYGRGDHLVDHLSRTVQTLPLFASVGFHERPIAPIAVEELVDVAVAAIEGRLTCSTVAVRGGETLLLSDAVRRVAATIGRRVRVTPAPIAFHYALAQLAEWTMRVPLLAKAQVMMLAEGVVDAAPPADELPGDLAPVGRFDTAAIRAALPDAGRFGLADLRARG
ncbi:NAD(P)H-binding protein [Microbacterium sp. ZW T5_56]|uniref:NAD(P)H-binding protein n=1 Tax=Microbacterium sp. ZW T5_56 TaxID=3378081 RepID=UPI00385228CD